MGVGPNPRTSLMKKRKMEEIYLSALEVDDGGEQTSTW
jgi:hypothetical protein